MGFAGVPMPVIPTPASDTRLASATDDAATFRETRHDTIHRVARRSVRFAQSFSQSSAPFDNLTMVARARVVRRCFELLDVAAAERQVIGQTRATKIAQGLVERPPRARRERKVVIAADKRP